MLYGTYHSRFIRNSFIWVSKKEKKKVDAAQLKIVNAWKYLIVKYTQKKFFLTLQIYVSFKVTICAISFFHHFFFFSLFVNLPLCMQCDCSLEDDAIATYFCLLRNKIQHKKSVVPRYIYWYNCTYMENSWAESDFLLSSWNILK